MNAPAQAHMRRTILRASDAIKLTALAMNPGRTRAGLMADLREAAAHLSAALTAVQTARDLCQLVQEPVEPAPRPWQSGDTPIEPYHLTTPVRINEPYKPGDVIAFCTDVHTTHGTTLPAGTLGTIKGYTDGDRYLVDAFDVTDTPRQVLCGQSSLMGLPDYVEGDDVVMTRDIPYAYDNNDNGECRIIPAGTRGIIMRVRSGISAARPDQRYQINLQWGAEGVTRITCGALSFARWLA